MEKFEIRERVKKLRLLMSELDKQTEADEICARLEQTAAFLLADRVLMYHSLPDEVSTRSFLAKWKDKKKFYLPRVNGVGLDILPYDESRLELGSFHIEEPTGNNLTDPEDIELVVVPGVAFDRKGKRIGRGKGFYDRFLKTSRATKIGVGFRFQLIDEIPTEPHDIGMDIVVTPDATIIVRKV